MIIAIGIDPGGTHARPTCGAAIVVVTPNLDLQRGPAYSLVCKGRCGPRDLAMLVRRARVVTGATKDDHLVVVVEDVLGVVEGKRRTGTTNHAALGIVYTMGIVEGACVASALPFHALAPARIRMLCGTGATAGKTQLHRMASRILGASMKSPRAVAMDDVVAKRAADLAHLELETGSPDEQDAMAIALGGARLMTSASGAGALALTALGATFSGVVARLAAARGARGRPGPAAAPAGARGRARRRPAR